MYRQVAVNIIKTSTTLRGNWRRGKNPLTLQRLQVAAVFYYGKFRLHARDELEPTEIAEEEDELRSQLKEWYEGILLDSMSKYRAERVDVVQWWLSQKDEIPELSTLAAFLLGIKVSNSSFPCSSSC